MTVDAKYKSFGDWWKVEGKAFLHLPNDQGFPINWESVIMLCVENGVTNAEDIHNIIEDIPEKTTAPEIMALIRSKAKGK
jgi:hypothetical protein